MINWLVWGKTKQFRQFQQNNLAMGDIHLKKVSPQTIKEMISFLDEHLSNKLDSLLTTLKQKLLDFPYNKKERRIV